MSSSKMFRAKNYLVQMQYAEKKASKWIHATGIVMLDGTVIIHEIKPEEQSRIRTAFKNAFPKGLPDGKKR